jgi:hypothetical protein
LEPGDFPICNPLLFIGWPLAKFWNGGAHYAHHFIDGGFRTLSRCSQLRYGFRYGLRLYGIVSEVVGNIVVVPNPVVENFSGALFLHARRWRRWLATSASNRVPPSSFWLDMVGVVNTARAYAFAEGNGHLKHYCSLRF